MYVAPAIVRTVHTAAVWSKQWHDNMSTHTHTISFSSHSLLFWWNDCLVDSICNLMRSLVSFHTGSGT